MIPGLGRTPGEGNGNPLQYYCLENPMDREAWQATVLGVARVGHVLAKKQHRIVDSLNLCGHSRRDLGQLAGTCCILGDKVFPTQPPLPFPPPPSERPSQSPLSEDFSLQFVKSVSKAEDQNNKLLITECFLNESWCVSVIIFHNLEMSLPETGIPRNFHTQDVPCVLETPPPCSHFPRSPFLFVLFYVICLQDSGSNIPLNMWRFSSRR